MQTCIASTIFLHQLPAVSSDIQVSSSLWKKRDQEMADNPFAILNISIISGLLFLSSIKRPHFLIENRRTCNPPAEVSHPPPSTSLPFPLEVGPLNLDRGLGERCKLPSGVWGGAPAKNAFVGHFEPRKTHLVATKLLFLFICWAKVLHNRRQEMSSKVIVSGGGLSPLAHL